jgi:hypothetical protein
MIVYGTRHYGRIEEFRNTYVVTSFIHIWFLPIIPTGSHLVLGESEDGEATRGIPAGLSGRSVFAGYLRVWGIFGVIGSLIALFIAAKSAFGAEDMTDALVDLVIAGFVFVVAAVVLVVAFGLIGRLSTEEKRKRLVYEHFAGMPVDPASLRDARAPIRERLMHTLAERAQGLAQSGYRTQVDPVTHWAQVALDPSVRDPAFIGAAFTLARLDTSLVQGAAKAQLEMTHHALWQRVLEIAPPPLNP